MKAGISIDCFEKDLFDALTECSLIMNAVDRQCIELKVKFQVGDAGHYLTGHRWITIYKDSRVLDVVKIYELEKTLKPNETLIEKKN